MLAIVHKTKFNSIVPRRWKISHNVELNIVQNKNWISTKDVHWWCALISAQPIITSLWIIVDLVHLSFIIWLCKPQIRIHFYKFKVLFCQHIFFLRDFCQYSNLWRLQSPLASSHANSQLSGKFEYIRKSHANVFSNCFSFLIFFISWTFQAWLFIWESPFMQNM